MTAETKKGALGRLLWFVLLWVGGVVTVSLIALLIRLILH